MISLSLSTIEEDMKSGTSVAKVIDVICNKMERREEKKKNNPFLFD